MQVLLPDLNYHLVDPQIRNLPLLDLVMLAVLFHTQIPLVQWSLLAQNVNLRGSRIREELT